ncbi:MAG: type VI secretion system baseplate subunit TssF [Phycisphaeraceae bacterium]|nr:MAG: type VI secretion system baseplate subunit TssF [Phycisphaeraceae bacterium]
MDRRLIRYYERELRHVRETAAEFAREYPKIAGRLALDEFECADPYVERLLEGFAFLAARVQLKLDAEFPTFTQHLLEAVYPHYLCPMPSMCIVQMRPDLEDSGLASGFTVPRGTALRSMIGRNDQTACEYRTAHELTLAPIELVEAQYHDRDLLSLELPRDVKAAAVIRLRLRASAGLMFSEIEVDQLPLLLRGAGALPSRVYERLVAHTSAMLVRPTTRPARWTHRLDPTQHLRQMGFQADEALLPVGPRSFEGYRHLQEYFAFPERFRMVEVSGLRAAFERCEAPTLEILFVLDEPDADLEQAIDPTSFALHCTPAINLFPKRSDRIHVTERFHEFHVVPDRTRPLEYEVYDITEVVGVGGEIDDERVFRPFYKASDMDDETGGGGAFFDTSRVPRTLTDKERRSGRRSSYPGSEVYLQLVDASSAPYRSDLKQLAIATRCTNRDLPLRMPVGQGRTDFSMDIGGSVESIRCIEGPTPPRPSFVEGEILWRLIGHLSLNYLSLADADLALGSDHMDPNASGAAAMRDLLKIYGNLAEAATRKQIDGLRSITSRPVTRRAPTKGPISFARGLQVHVHFEESYFEGSGCFLLGAVLERFFAKYVSINSFTETVVQTRERGEIMRWPTRIGTRHTL